MSNNICNKRWILLAIISLFIVQINTNQQTFFKCDPVSNQLLCNNKQLGPVCALDDDDQYLTIKTACQACSYQDTVAYTLGACACPKISCSPNQSCVEKKCIDYQQLNEQQLIQEANTLLGHQKNKQAIQLLEKVITKNETNHYAYYLASLASFALQKNKDSLKFIKKAILLEPNVPQYYIIRGRAFGQDKQFEQAEKQFQKVLSMGFDDLGLISYYQAQVLLKEQRNQQCIKKFEQALLAHPQKTQWYVRKAMAHAINKQYKMAMLTCRMGLKIDPNNQQIKLFMKQFLTIDQGKQEDLELVRQQNLKQGNSTGGMDPEFVNKMMRQRAEQQQQAWQAARRQQKKKKAEQQRRRAQQQGQEQQQSVTETTTETGTTTEQTKGQSQL